MGARSRAILVAVSVLLPPARWVAAQAPPNPERLLTPGDVEQAGGVKGIVQKKTASGDLKFSRQAGGTALLTVTFHFAADFAAQRKAVGNTQPIAGVGEEAVIFGDGLSLVFRKGRYSVQLTSGINVNTMKPVLTIPQLTSLGKLIASRL